MRMNKNVEPNATNYPRRLFLSHLNLWFKTKCLSGRLLMRLSFFIISDSRTACSCLDSFTLQHTVLVSICFPGVHVTTSLELRRHACGLGQHLQLFSLLESKT